MNSAISSQKKVTKIWIGWDRCYAKEECSNECFIVIDDLVYILRIPCSQIILLMKVFNTQEITKDSPVDFFMKQHEKTVDKIEHMSVRERKSESEKILKKIGRPTDLFTFGQPTN